MTNKKTLKKSIKLICEELFVECVAASLYSAKGHRDDAEALLFTIIKTQADYTSRISHPEPGLPAKVYFRDLRDKFTARVTELIDQINNL